MQHSILYMISLGNIQLHKAKAEYYLKYYYYYKFLSFWHLRLCRTRSAICHPTEIHSTQTSTEWMSRYSFHLPNQTDGRLSWSAMCQICYLMIRCQTGDWLTLWYQSPSLKPCQWGTENPVVAYFQRLWSYYLTALYKSVIIIIITIVLS